MLDTTQHMCHILDARYEKANLHKVAPESKHLTEKERAMIHNVLIKHELLFDGTLVTWNTKTLDIELQPDAKP